METWISLPKEYRPADWDTEYEEPVVLLKRNLYGHPLAGWYWEVYAADILTKHGFEKVPGWECLWVYKAKGLFVSVYVDDFKMAGRKAAEKEMWDILREDLDLEDPVPLDGSTCLGVGQKDHQSTQEQVAAKREGDVQALLPQ